jgi:hypothetical protein
MGEQLAKMDAKYFCTTMQSELTGIKARVYDIIHSVEKMPQENKDALTPKIPELYTLVEGLSKKLDELNTLCPADWSAQKKEIEEKKEGLVEKINYWDAEHIAAGFLGG